MTPSKTDSLHMLFRKLRVSNREEHAAKYILMVRHSRSLRLRQTSVDEASSGADESVYRRAGLRTPAENASKDIEGGVLWIKHVTLSLSRLYENVVWLRACTRQRAPPWVEALGNVRAIDAALDPFGWDQDDSINLESLESIIEAVRERIETVPGQHQQTDSPIPLVVESLTPILQRHGFRQTLLFLQQLSKLAYPLVVFVLEESVETRQLLALEDEVEGVLYVSGGGALLLRQGVRERGNLVRESITYRIKKSGGGDKEIEIVADTNADEVEATIGAPDVEYRNSSSYSAVDESTTATATDGRRKIMLQLEDDNARRQNTSTNSSPGPPRIFVQDDDPEFDDYDEEDPDDDLDI